nr:hypothetical protein [Pseudomonas sp.]
MVTLRAASSGPISTRHLWMFVVVLALAARSSIPMGYMLDSAAMQSGSLRLILCSFGALLPKPQQNQGAPGPQQGHHPSSLTHEGNEHALHHASHAVAPEEPLSHPAEHGEAAHSQACPFGLMMAQGLATPPVDDVVVLTLPSLVRAVLPGLAPEALPPLPPLGPPLGSRAPPFFLG